MRLFFHLMLALGVCCSVSIGVERAFAQDAPAERIAKLVTDLGNDSFTRRQQAEAELISAGSEADRLLANAMQHNSLEVRSRAESILRRRKINAVWEPTLHEYPGGNVPLGVVLKHYSKTIGPTGSYSPGGPIGSEIQIDAGQVSALEALASAADQLGYRIQSTESKGRHDSCPMVQFSDCRNFAGRSFSGPLMLELISAKQDPQTNELHLDLQLMWEPCFELVSHSANPATIQLVGSEIAGKTVTSQISIDWHVLKAWHIERGDWHTTQQRRVKPIRVRTIIDTTGPISRIDQIKLKWPICAAATVGSVVIDRQAYGKQVVTPAGEITIDDRSAFRVENIRSWPEPREAILQNCHACCQFLKHCEMTSVGASWTVWSPFDDAGQSLRINYRTDFSRKDMEFVFDGVPVTSQE